MALIFLVLGLFYFWLLKTNLQPVKTNPIVHKTQIMPKSEPIKEKSLSFLFFGDIMLDRHVKEKINISGLDYLLAPLSASSTLFLDKDLISANLEGPVTDSGAHYPPEASIDFAFDPELVRQLKENYNFDFFNLAANHLLDQGSGGLQETYKNLDTLDLDYSGCPDSVVSDCSTTIVEIKDKKIGLAGFSMVYNPINLEAATSTIFNLKKQTDLVIVNIHWGVEYTHYFNQNQQRVAHALVDAGADIIIGHHPHVVQGMETYKNKPIFYSLGNFIFDQYFSPDTQEGLAVEIMLDGNNYDISLFPLKSNLSQVRLMNSAEKEVFMQNFAEWSDLLP